MNNVQTLGMEAFLSFLLVFTSAALAARRKVQSIEGLVVLGSVLALSAILGKPLFFPGASMQQSLWFHLAGPTLGAILALLLYRYLSEGKSDKVPKTDPQYPFWLQREKILKLPLVVRWLLLLFTWAALLIGFNLITALALLNH